MVVIKIMARSINDTVKDLSRQGDAGWGVTKKDGKVVWTTGKNGKMVLVPKSRTNHQPKTPTA